MEQTNIAQKVINWLKKEEKFCDFILTPDGNLFADPEFETPADWFAVYYNGHVCIRPNGNLFCLGALPGSCITFPIYMGESTVYANSDSQCVIRGEDPVLSDDSSAFAVFQFGSLVGMYTADAMFSRRIYFRLEASTPEAKKQCMEGFFQQLDRHDPQMRKRLESWLNSRGASWKGA